MLTVSDPRKPIDPGKLRQLLVFTRNAATRDASGGFGNNPQPVFSVRGKLEPLPKGDWEKYGGVNWTTGFTRYTAVMRWRPDVTDDMSINLGTRVFAVRGVPQVERSDRYMEVVCEEVTT